MEEEKVYSLVVSGIKDIKGKKYFKVYFNGSFCYVEDKAKRGETMLYKKINCKLVLSEKNENNELVCIDDNDNSKDIQLSNKNEINKPIYVDAYEVKDKILMISNWYASLLENKGFKFPVKYGINRNRKLLTLDEGPYLLFDDELLRMMFRWVFNSNYTDNNITIRRVLGKYKHISTIDKAMELFFDLSFYWMSCKKYRYEIESKCAPGYVLFFVKEIMNVFNDNIHYLTQYVLRRSYLSDDASDLQLVQSWYKYIGRLAFEFCGQEYLLSMDSRTKTFFTYEIKEEYSVLEKTVIEEMTKKKEEEEIFWNTFLSSTLKEQIAMRAKFRTSLKQNEVSSNKKMNEMNKIISKAEEEERLEKEKKQKELDEKKKAYEQIIYNKYAEIGLEAAIEDIVVQSKKIKSCTNKGSLETLKLKLRIKKVALKNLIESKKKNNKLKANSFEKTYDIANYSLEKENYIPVWNEYKEIVCKQIEKECKIADDPEWEIMKKDAITQQEQRRLEIDNQIKELDSHRKSFVNCCSGYLPIDNIMLGETFEDEVHPTEYDGIFITRNGLYESIFIDATIHDIPKEWLRAGMSKYSSPTYLEAILRTKLSSDEYIEGPALINGLRVDILILATSKDRSISFEVGFETSSRQGSTYMFYGKVPKLRYIYVKGRTHNLSEKRISLIKSKELISNETQKKLRKIERQRKDKLTISRKDFYDVFENKVHTNFSSYTDKTINEQIIRYLEINHLLRYLLRKFFYNDIINRITIILKGLQDSIYNNIQISKKNAITENDSRRKSEEQNILDSLTLRCEHMSDKKLELLVKAYKILDEYLCDSDYLKEEHSLLNKEIDLIHETIETRKKLAEEERLRQVEEEKRRKEEEERVRLKRIEEERIREEERRRKEAEEKMKSNRNIIIHEIDEPSVISKQIADDISNHMLQLNCFDDDLIIRMYVKATVIIKRYVFDKYMLPRITDNLCSDNGEEVCEKDPNKRQMKLELYRYYTHNWQFNVPVEVIVELSKKYYKIKTDVLPARIERKFRLNWAMVYFDRGEFVIRQSQDKGLLFDDSFFTYGRSSNVLRDFALHYNEQIPEVICSAQDRKLNVDMDALNRALRFIVGKKDEFDRQRLAFIRYTHQITAGEFNRLKTNCIQFLSDMQLNGYDLYSITEIATDQRRNQVEEDAVLFTIDGRSDSVIIVLENLNKDRATYLFKVKKVQYWDALNRIKEYFEDDDITGKRNKIIFGDKSLESLSVTRYKRVKHLEYEFELWQDCLLSAIQSLR